MEGTKLHSIYLINCDNAVILYTLRKLATTIKDSKLIQGVMINIVILFCFLDKLLLINIQAVPGERTSE